MNVLGRQYDNYLPVMICVFFILPILLGISTFYKGNFAEDIILYSIEYFNNPYFGFNLLSYFQYSIFIVMLVLYPIYPSVFSIEKFFIKRKFQNSPILEYEGLKKIIYILFPFFIFAFIFILGQTIMKTQNPLIIVINIISNIIPPSIFVISLGVVFFIVASALLKIIFLFANKESRFYFSKIFFKQISNKNIDGNETIYLVKGLNSYNKYLRRNIGLQINDLKNIYSKILSDPTIDKNYVIKNLSLAFDDTDKFRTVKRLSELLNIKDTEHFLTKESVGKKLEDVAAKLGTIASTVAAIIGILLTIIEFPGFP
ncbi:MAG: hypothetical protein K0S93_2243 [Nitrososphaeraceae archaeon]|jgi:hypothetical protein|nr:hypothetical protein [Nitrososphaeraceae archaeon]